MPGRIGMRTLEKRIATIEELSAASFLPLEKEQLFMVRYPLLIAFCALAAWKVLQSKEIWQGGFLDLSRTGHAEQRGEALAGGIVGWATFSAGGLRPSQGLSVSQKGGRRVGH